MLGPDAMPHEQEAIHLQHLVVLFECGSLTNDAPPLGVVLLDLVERLFGFRKVVS
jgi:hypothetical protein